MLPGPNLLHGFPRENFYSKQLIPDRNVDAPFSHEVLSSKILTTVSRHTDDFLAEENSTKVQHILLATSAEGGICKCDSHMLKYDQLSATFSEFHKLFGICMKDILAG